MTTSLVPNHQAVQLDAEVHPILYKRQLDIQDTSALHHQTMPIGNVKSKPVSAKVSLINCSPHCSGSWSLHQQGKMPHSHTITHPLPWTVSVRKQKLLTDSLASAKWPYFWGRKNQAKKNAKPVSSVWKSPTEDALQVQQVQQHNCRYPGNFRHKDLGIYEFVSISQVFPGIIFPNMCS